MVCHSTEPKTPADHINWCKQLYPRTIFFSKLQVGTSVGRALMDPRHISLSHIILTTGWVPHRPVHFPTPTQVVGACSRPMTVSRMMHASLPDMQEVAKRQVWGLMSQRQKLRIQSKWRQGKDTAKQSQRSRETRTDG